MKTRQTAIIIPGFVFLIAYIIIANSMQLTQYPWLLTRAFGLIAILLLFLSVFLRELKYQGINILCKEHCMLGILTFYFALLHLISAIFDKLVWGKNLTLPDYLGANYSDKWMILISLGAIAFYMMIIVSLTSSDKIIKRIGCSNWKLVHGLAYLSLIIVFIHSILLGTDLNHSDLRGILYPLAVFLFSILIMLLVIRLFRIYCTIRFERTLTFLTIVLSALLITYAADQARIHSEYTIVQDGIISDNLNEINLLQGSLDNLNNSIRELKTQISILQNKTQNIK